MKTRTLGIVGVAIAAACAGSDNVAPDNSVRINTTPKFTSYAGYIGTPLTVTITPDDDSGMQRTDLTDGYSYIVPTTTTSYARTLRANVTGGSGSYKIVWYERLCTVLFAPTRNS